MRTLRIVGVVLSLCLSACDVTDHQDAVPLGTLNEEQENTRAAARLSFSNLDLYAKKEMAPLDELTLSSIQLCTNRLYLSDGWAGTADAYLAEVLPKLYDLCDELGTLEAGDRPTAEQMSRLRAFLAEVYRPVN